MVGSHSLLVTIIYWWNILAKSFDFLSNKCLYIREAKTDLILENEN
jgi:hypothetical protein